MASDPVKELFDQLKGSFTDILNVGRIIFYPFAGFLTIVPFYMIVRLLLDEQPSRLLSTQMLKNLHNITNTTLTVTFTLFMSSLVVGFLLATVGFPMLIDGLGPDISMDVEGEPLAMNSFPYNYPLLRNKKDKDEDYAGWLISEYYRYVEIVTYIPLGGYIGLVLIEVYVFVFLLRAGSAGLTAAHTIFLIILGTLVLIKYYVWPEIWVKRILIPVLRTYLRAKRNLINGLRVSPNKIS